jgi:hypothetical protein
VGTEGTFLYNPSPPYINIGIDPLFHCYWDLVLMPIEIFDIVRTGSHAEPTPNAALPDLGNYPFGVTVSGIDGADLYARWFVTVHAGTGNKSSPSLGIFPVRFSDHLHPTNHSTSFGLLLSDKWNVVFIFTSNQTSLTG